MWRQLRRGIRRDPTVTENEPECPSPGPNLSASDAPERRPARRGYFASFSIPSFRLQWSADLMSVWGFEMETLILGWSVLVETDSPFLLSVIVALRWGGTLIGPVMGVVADRIARRTILIGMRCLLATLAASLMAGGLTHTLEIWHLFVVATLSGLIRPSEWMVRQSLIADIVPRVLLMNALGFARITMDSARIAGALLGAGLLSALGIGIAYVVVTGMYLISIVLTVRIAPAPASPSSSGGGPLSSASSDLRLGLSYIRGSPLLLGIMCIAFLVNLSAMPVTQGLLPVMARDLYGYDANGLAWMITAVAAGALTGSLLLAMSSRPIRPELTMFAAFLVWHLLILALAAAPSPPVAFAVLAVIGVLMSLAMVPMATVLIGHTDSEFRGRVIGVRMLAVYGMPIGLLAGGALTEWVGVSATLAVFGLGGLALFIGIAFKWRAWTAGTIRQS